MINHLQDVSCQTLMESPARVLAETNEANWISGSNNEYSNLKTATNLNPKSKTSDKRRALITGVNGQVGSYLAELLLSKNYQVHGMIRRESCLNNNSLLHLFEDKVQRTSKNFHLHYGDLTDSNSLYKLISEIKPHEVYNLAAQSHVKISFDMAEMTGDTNALGTLRLLEAIRRYELMVREFAVGDKDNKKNRNRNQKFLDDYDHQDQDMKLEANAMLSHTRDTIEKIPTRIKFYQASTSELYGGSFNQIPQDEQTPFYPKSPYACSKLYAHSIVVNYRESYKMFALNGILFNHESPRRGQNFVTRKITRAVAEIKLGRRQYFELGALDSRRDWGHARDYAVAMWLMLQRDEPRDYVVASGESRSVRDFVQEAFRIIGVKIRWSGAGLKELGYDTANGQVRVMVSEKYFRPSEVDHLLGDSSLARRELGWRPKTSFQALVEEMVLADIELLKRDASA